jgi:hypothetical protein
VIARNLFHDRAIFILLHSLQDQRWIGGGILRCKGLDRLEVAGVGDDGGVLLQLFELVHDGLCLSLCA